MFAPNFDKGIKVWDYIASCGNPGHAAKKVLRDIFDLLSTKLHAKTFDNTEIWFELVKHGANPVDIIFPLISNTSIWYTGLTDFVPNFSSVTHNQGAENLSDDLSARINGQTCDLLINQVLALPTTIYAKEDAALFKTPQARLFAVFLSSKNIFAACAYSPKLTECFEAWVDELKGMADEYKMRGACYALDQLCKLDDGQHRFSISESFRAPGLAMVQNALSKLSELRIAAGTEDTMDATQFNSYSRVFDYLEMSNEQRVGFCEIIAKIGNEAITNAAMASLINDPVIFAKGLSQIGVDDQRAQDIFRLNIRRESWFHSDKFGDLGYVEAFIESHRQALIDQGFEDILRTKAIDPIVQNLEIAEHFQRAGLLRREDMGESSMFAYYASGVSYDHTQRNPTPDDVIHRKVDLAINLNQREMLMQVADVYFKGHRKTNQDLCSDTAIKYLLERQYFVLSELLSTDRRVEKALELGVNKKMLFEDKNIKPRWKALTLENELGL